jgi:hypothetical protein
MFVQTMNMRSYGPQLLARRAPVARVYSSSKPSTLGGTTPYDPAPLPPPAATVPDSVGDKVSEWLKTPFDFAAFGPRVTVGALLSAPERLRTLSTEIEKVQDILASPAPANDKSKMVAAELERFASVPGLMLPTVIRIASGSYSDEVQHTLRTSLAVVLSNIPCVLVAAPSDGLVVAQHQLQGMSCQGLCCPPPASCRRYLSTHFGM